MADVVEFKQSIYRVTEGQSVIVAISRTGTGVGEVSVKVSLRSESATVGKGKDISWASQVLVWPEGDTNDKTITLEAIADLYAEGKETAQIRLSSLKGATYGALKIAQLEIVDAVNPQSAIAHNDLIRIVKNDSEATIPFSSLKAAVTSGLNLGQGSPGSAVIPTEIWDDNNNAVEFFLDTENGDDSADGRSPTTAVKTWAKAVSILKEKRFSWNWNTYLRIKGTLQAPLDLRGIYGDANDWWTQGTLALHNWDNSPNWVLEGVADWNQSKLAFLQDNDHVNLWIQGATLINKTRLVFDKVSTWFSNVTFVSEVSHSSALTFGNGYYGLSGTITLNYAQAQFSLLAVGNNTKFQTQCDVHFINASETDRPLLMLRLGASLEVGNLNCQGVSLRQVNIERQSSALLSNWNNVNFIRDNSSTIKQNIDFNDCQTTVHHFTSMSNGRYLLAMAPRKGRLIEWNLWARSGLGTFQMDVNGQLWGDPLTGTFSNYEPRLNRAMNFDSPWINAYRFFMNVSNSSALTDVVIQLIWRDY